jgi:hypothetical protein
MMTVSGRVPDTDPEVRNLRREEAELQRLERLAIQDIERGWPPDPLPSPYFFEARELAARKT